MLNAIINCRDKTAVLEFPMDLYQLYQDLHDIGFQGGPHRVKLTDNEEDDIRVKLYSDNDFGNHLILLLKESDIITDRYTPDVHYANREGWQKVLNICKTDTVDFVVIPSISMITKCIVDMVHLFKYMRESYGADVYLMYEEIASTDKDSDTRISYFLMTEEYKERLRKNERKLRGHFYDATQINREISAVPILIDNKVYEKIERLSRYFGVDVQSVMNQFFDVLDRPDNLKLFEKIMGWEDDE